MSEQPRTPRLHAVNGSARPPQLDPQPRPQAPAPAARARIFDDRINALLRAEYLRGCQAGERRAYVKGWRLGALHGACGIVALAVLAAAAIVWARGWLP